MDKPKIAVYGLTCCAGCQLNILNCEDELLELAAAVDLKSFIMAQTGNSDCEVDIAFVEGAVASERNLKQIKDIRERAGLLVALGTGACWGCVQAMINDVPRKEVLTEVYGDTVLENPFFECFEPKPLRDFVKVDYEIVGCPIERSQFLQAVASFLHRDKPLLPTYSVCTDCKFRENECLLIERGEMCLGPVTKAGCGARCPSNNLPCEGCRGPVFEANFASEVDVLLDKGYTIEQIRQAMSHFGGPPSDEALKATKFKGTELP